MRIFLEILIISLAALLAFLVALGWIWGLGEVSREEGERLRLEGELQRIQGEELKRLGDEMKN